MDNSLLLKKEPRIEIQFTQNGFHIFDEQKNQNSGFHPYHELTHVELNKTWFPKLSIWLRVITCILNGVPFFPDADSCKTANIIFHFDHGKQGIWLTDTFMVNQAKKLKQRLAESKSGL
jgi:hypothetical protein